jgi:hypothetical protein
LAFSSRFKGNHENYPFHEIFDGSVSSKNSNGITFLVLLSPFFEDYGMISIGIIIFYSMSSPVNEDNYTINIIWA